MSSRKQGAGVRSPGGCRARPSRRFSVVSAAFLLLAAAPVWAAHVVDVRVGYHPTFVRVVFELDSPTGYRVERHAPVPGVSELVITLDASSETESLVARDQSLIEGIELLSEGDRSVAHIRLARDGLKLKEMILASPPRIVLDVLAEKKAAQAAPSVAKAEPKPKAIEPEKVVRAEPSAPVVVEKPAPSPATGGEPAEEPPESPSLAETGRAVPAAPGAALPTSPGGSQLQQLALAKPPAAAPVVPPVPAASRPPPKPAAQPRAMPPPRPAAAARPRPQPKPAAVPPPAEESFFTGTVMMAVGAVVVLALGAVGLARRRRSSSAVEDEDFDGAEMDQENPFAGFDADSAADVEAKGKAEGQQGDTGEFAFAEDEGEAAKAASAQPLAVSDDSEPQEGSDMDQRVSENASTVILDSPPIASVGVSEQAGDGADVMRLFTEFERRVASLETRLDEAVDARERLERQVAAQTEELRVQRAAIARTQRAVRNLSRPEEDTAPTEPALRDPTRPEGPRG